MGDDYKEVYDLYSKSNEQQITELNKLIVALRTKVNYLERELEARDKVPLPKSIVQQIMNLEAENARLKNDIKYYKNHVQPQVIINKENKSKPTRRGGVPK